MELIFIGFRAPLMRLYPAPQPILLRHSYKPEAVPPQLRVKQRSIRWHD